MNGFASVGMLKNLKEMLPRENHTKRLLQFAQYLLFAMVILASVANVYMGFRCDKSNRAEVIENAPLLIWVLQN